MAAEQATRTRRRTTDEEEIIFVDWLEERTRCGSGCRSDAAARRDDRNAEWNDEMIEGDGGKGGDAIIGITRTCEREREREPVCGPERDRGMMPIYEEEIYCERAALS